MPVEVSRILVDLHEDHRNMKMLLELIEREANRILDEEEPDFELLHDIMHYMTVYPDAVHHPRENRLYAELRKVRPDLTAGFRKISVDHDAIAEQGLLLRDELAAAEAGTAVRRKRLVADALRYVNSLRSHMHWEEQDLFQRCREMLRDGHDILVDDVPAGEDPLFDRPIPGVFGRLITQIRERNAEQLACPVTTDTGSPTS